MFVGLDERLRIRDLFYPRIGLFNHLSGHAIRFGVWVDGFFSWLDDEGWHRSISYQEGALLGRGALHRPGLDLEVELRMALDPEEDAFELLVGLRNLSDRDRDVRFFATHDLRISESDIGDTALYHPFSHSLIHYKGRVALLFALAGPEGGFDQYACGIKAFAGMEGTWRDAEDGELSMNPIAQGSVDSTIRLRTRLGAHHRETLSYTIAAGPSLEDVAERHMSRCEGEAAILDRAAAADRRYLESLRTPGAMPAEVAEALAKGVLAMRTHVDEGGAIIAATDSDIMETNRANYAYFWPRDGALIASVFAKLGDSRVAHRLFGFTERLVRRNRPFFLQKYRADGTFGASWHPWVSGGVPEVPLQEDETALTVLASWTVYQSDGDLGALRDRWPYVSRLARFLVEFRDPETALPLPSYDLWEERRGIHTFTTAAVVAGLEAAASMSETLGEDSSFRTAAQETQHALRVHLFDSERGVFLRRIVPVDGGTFEQDRSVDASALQVGLLGALPMQDGMVISNLEVVERTLWVDTPIGGLARYEDDYYFRVDGALPGNPWIITTMWLAQSLLALRRGPDDLARVDALIAWAIERGGATGLLPEQVDPHSGCPLSVSPLPWSHAELVGTIFERYGEGGP
jgi:GH15 family glucan-1,4-alpha-glucosidase